MKKTQTKTKKTNKFKGIAVIALSAIMLIGGCVVGYGAGTHWTYKRGAVQTTTPDDIGKEDESANSSFILSDNEEEGANFLSRALNASEYADYGINAQSIDSARVATVTLANHSEATDKLISLTAEFEDGTSASEYISFSSDTVQSGEQFTISCLKAFGQPITIKATANGVQEGVKPSCIITANYVAKYDQLVCVIGDSTDLDGDFNYRLNNFRLYSDNWGTDYREDSFVYKVSNQTKSMGLKGDQYANNVMLYTYESAPGPDDPEVYGTIIEEIKNVKIAATAPTDKPNWDNYEGTETSFQMGGEDKFSGLTHNELSLYYVESREQRDFEAWCNVDKEIRRLAGGDYFTILENYNAKKITARLWIQFTGAVSGITYELYIDFLVNPQYLYVPAENPSDNVGGGIIF